MSAVFLPVAPSQQRLPRRRSKAPSSSSGGSTSSFSGFPMEMSPEKTLVEFISTSAAYFNVKRKALSALENEICRVGPNNIMPANAAAWYLAKRKYYLNNPPEFQLLPFLLKNHQDKFTVKGGYVEFKETYDKETALRKLRDLNRLGLVAYFTHKVDEYGVYLFDPLYYEKTEPFHSGLQAATKGKGNKGSMLATFFEGVSQLHLTKVNNFLLSLSFGPEPIEVRSNVTGVVVKMLNKTHGVLQFGTEDGTAKAVFSTKALFKDGFSFKNGDPMALPAMEFDGYRLPRRTSGAAALEYSWCAVLVWCGKKPSPKYNATKATLMAEDAFGGAKSNGGQSVFDDLLSQPGPNGDFKSDTILPRERSRANVFNPIAHKPVVTECMQIGEVVQLKRDGALVTLSKDKNGEKSFVPGWLAKSTVGTKAYLSTAQGVSLFVGDLIGYYVDAAQSPKYGAIAVGFNVIVLKHKDDSKKGKDGKKVNGKKSRTVSETSDARASSSDERADSKVKKTRKVRTKSTTSDGGESQTENKAAAPRVKAYLRFLLSDPVSDSESIHSDADPHFHTQYFDSDLDYDEYSDGEIAAEEVSEIQKSGTADLDVDELLRLLTEDEEKRKQEAKEAREKKIQEAKDAREKKIQEAKEAREAEREARLAARAAKKAEAAAAKSEDEKEPKTDEKDAAEPKKVADGASDESSEAAPSVDEAAPAAPEKKAEE